MRRYVTSGTQAASATEGVSVMTAVTTPGASPQRCAIYEWNVGPSGATAAADEVYTIRVQRYTGAFTWTSSITPAPIDPADAACLAGSGTNSTAVGTGGTILGDFGVAMRQGFRWVAIPDSELIIPASTTNSIAVRFQAISSGATGDLVATMYFIE